jgi:peptidoglycan LD-endopeptidase CwlK
MIQEKRRMTPDEIKQKVLEAETQGRLMFNAGASLERTDTAEFVLRPVEEILSDLNRTPDVILKDTESLRWINDYAAMQVIKELHRRLTEKEHLKMQEAMYSYSVISKERLASAHPTLQDIFNEVIKYVDCTIMCGHREQAAQNKAVVEGKSKTRFPFSPHNQVPAMAIDAGPYPIDWEDHERFALFAGVVLGIAAMKGVKLKWGGDWNGNFNLKDQTFVDMPHFELVQSSFLKTA